MNNREKEILGGIKNILIEQLKPKRITLFGSRAKGNKTSRADFDVAVDCPTPKMSIQRKIKDKVDAIIGLYKADIVYIDMVDDKFKEIIIKTGKVLYEKRK